MQTYDHAQHPGFARTDDLGLPLAARAFTQALTRIVRAESADEAVEGLADALASTIPLDALRLHQTGEGPRVTRTASKASLQALDRLAASRRRLLSLRLDGIELSVVRPARQLWGVAGRIDVPQAILLVEATGPGAPPDEQQLQSVVAAAICFRGRLQTIDAVARRERHARIVANVAHAIHDLRSPVANSLGFLSLLKRTLPVESQEYRWTDIALEELRRLRTMLAGLLDVTRSEIGFDHIRPTELDLAQLVRSTTAVIAEAAGREVRVSAPVAVPVQADSAAMTKLVTNLLENALKYSPATSVVHVAVETDETLVRLSVRDEGTGIEPDDMLNIFEPFVRSESTETAQPGLGLGLSICRSIVRIHGGRIFVESTLGQGSTFRVELPRWQSGTDVPSA